MEVMVHNFQGDYTLVNGLENVKLKNLCTSALPVPVAPGHALSGVGETVSSHHFSCSLHSPVDTVTVAVGHCMKKRSDNDLLKVFRSFNRSCNECIQNTHLDVFLLQLKG